MGAVMIWLFAVPWTAFSLFWEAMAIGGWLFGTGKGPTGWSGFGMVLFGLPFLGIGLAFMSAPLWAARLARHSIYVLTDERLVCLTEKRNGMSVKSTWPRDIHSIEKTERADGTGSIKISLGSTRDSEGDLVEKRETVEGVENVGELYRHLCRYRRVA